LKERKGKLAAIKNAMLLIKTPVVVFSDANAMLNKECVQKIVRHYLDPRVGGVAGEKKIIHKQKQSAIGEAEGFYWKYESFMKKMDAAFNTVIGAAGELFSIRTDLFKNIPDNLILDDFVFSMNVCLQGYKLEYEPEAYASETPSSSLVEEEKRKVRISAGAYQSIGYLKEALNFFKHPLLSFQYVFRRLFRWILCPLLIIVLLFTNIVIVAIEQGNEFYSWFLGLQLFFYLLSFIGWLLVKSGKSAGVLNIPFYFVFMNYCLVKGFFSFIRGTQTVLWEKSIRESISATN
jgi:cellulose synthase/poly-beta-1,6-N-acetylglucosamine synthase-like glycosyltransferase